MHMTNFLLFLLTLSTFSLSAQFTVEFANPKVLRADGSPFGQAWLGGLNAPQWNSSDLDGDGRADLLLFDRAGDVLISLRGNEKGDYQFDPSLSAGFPAGLNSWLLLRDYDLDGNDDLITYAAEFDGVAIYRGDRDPEGLLTFPATPTFAGLRYPVGNDSAPVFITTIDYPAFDDLDGDGDLDLLTFSVGGGYVEHYKNQSVERGFGADSLIYLLESDCWGGLFESGLTPELDLAAAPGDCFRNNLSERPVEFRHAGSSVLTVDLDGNGLKDILLGDISFDKLVAGYNTGTLDEAYISRQDVSYPGEGKPVKINFFPAAFHLDIDGDGNRDLVASPNQARSAEDKQVGWYYRNQGTDADPDFAFQTSSLLVGESLDFGTGAIPTVFDYDADGWPDLIIGNADTYSPDGAIRSQLRLFRNETPPGGEVVFRLVDEDYLSLAQFQTTTSAFAPAFGDLDGDGDFDAIVGERVGTLIFFKNTAGPNRPATFAEPVFAYQDIDASQLSKPAIADLDRDGRNDLIVGGFDGRIRYYHNNGTAAAARFDADPTAAGNRLQLGGINTNAPGFSSGHPTPLVLSYDDRFLLLTGNREGKLEAYRFTTPDGAFTTLSEWVGGLDFGGFSNPALGDFDRDGILELVVGNERGGVNYYRTDLPAARPNAIFDAAVSAFTFSLSPNPATTSARLTGLPGSPVQWISIHSTMGRVVARHPAHGLSAFQLQLGGLPAGFYTVTVSGTDGVGVSKLLVR